ncbi:unnamed protein product [Schistosoma curassoni]|uniref:Uncharacterized protein n=1 Tax=Schistosoma curassoni TaxID=6186 RepID=A0A183KB87_9TREM|nr:unnamed protein product [Schistosoma curassoni]
MKILTITMNQLHPYYPYLMDQKHLKQQFWLFLINNQHLFLLISLKP